MHESYDFKPTTFQSLLFQIVPNRKRNLTIFYHLEIINPEPSSSNIQDNAKMHSRRISENKRKNFSKVLSFPFN